MGAWGTNIMDNDTADDVEWKFSRELMKGTPLEDAIKELLQDMLTYDAKSYHVDETLALAYLQLEADRIHVTSKKAALKAIQDELEQQCEIWNEPEERAAILRDFQQKIEVAKVWGTDFEQEIIERKIAENLK